MTLVTLVVVGHFWAILPDTGFTDHLYDSLYLWHMPAFVLVTGYLSRSSEWTRPRLVGLVTTVAVPYVVFESLYALFRLQVGDERFAELYLDPHWLLWFLTALLVWRLATPLLTRHWAAVPAASAIRIVGGTWAGFLLAGLVGAAAFLAAAPRRGGWYADAGRWTIVVYLFHGFFVKGLGYSGFGGWSDTHPLAGLLVTTVLGVVVALLLAWTPLARRLTPTDGLRGRACDCARIVSVTRSRFPRPGGETVTP